MANYVMIRLTLNAHSEPEIHLFNKAVILIGTEQGHVDLVLNEQNIQPVHLKIVKQDEFPILINCSNDPFASVNGLPFGKKLLNSGDIITLNQTTLLFENLETLPKPAIEISTSPIYEPQNQVTNVTAPSSSIFLEQNLEPSVEGHFSPSFHLPFESDIEALGEDELIRTPLDEILKGLESELLTPKTNSRVAPSEKIEPEKKNKASLKDDYLKDLEDDHQTAQKGPYGDELEPSHLYQAWKWILLFIFSLLAISAAAGTIIYYSVSDKTEAHETKAAQGMADITMALLNAQLNEHIPPNQNWTDVEFLKTNLQVILPQNSSYASQIDSQGQFNCCPYSLRIYTSEDLSHFLLIAQPAPNLLNWLIPQSLIVVDSHLMELRILKDVRSLNRLLANPNPLDGVNGKEITALAKQGMPIRLASLAIESTHLDFAPPKNLAWLRPGSENLIYNAPRYYRLGSQILEKSIALTTSKGSSQEVMALKEEVENLSKLNPLMIYSNQGKNSALQARQGIKLFAPTDNLLFGYVLFNAQGKIDQVHLIKGDEEPAETPFLKAAKEEELIALQNTHEIERAEENLKQPSTHSPVDTNHPLFIQLHSFATARENELKPLVTAFVALLNEEIKNPRLDLREQFQELTQTYLNADAGHKEIIKQNIDLLYHQYEDIPADQFLSFIEALNLEQLLEMREEDALPIDPHFEEREVNLMTAIENSQSLDALDSHIHNAGKWLHFDQMKEPHAWAAYQNRFRNKLLEELENYLVSPKKHPLLKLEDPKDKEALLHILSHECFIRPEEKEFFLNEFQENLKTKPIRDSSLFY